jgi:hypothetical protein
MLLARMRPSLISKMVKPDLLPRTGIGQLLVCLPPECCAKQRKLFPSCFARFVDVRAASGREETVASREIEILPSI